MDIDTFDTGSHSQSAESGGGASVPCLTVICHPDPRRIGERALLSALWLHQSVRVSRIETTFAHPGSELFRPLQDPFLTRAPSLSVCAASGRSGALQVMSESGRVSLGGSPLTVRTVEPEELRCGLTLRLSSRIALLLHTTRNRDCAALPEVVGHSDSMTALQNHVRRVARLSSPVLIRGETGTGKELVARALHGLGARCAGPFVAVNMATLAEGTAASSLFGHRRGAFTGADTAHAGLFEQARGGTLFLDEVGETPGAVQPMLLRVLEQGAFLPVGAERERRTDVRVVAATDAALERAISQGAFRPALLHRLVGCEVRVPTLRERKDDIPRLLLRFLRLELAVHGLDALLEAGAGTRHPPLSSDAMVALCLHAYPGNVRELRNLARRIVADSFDTGRLDLSGVTDVCAPSDARRERPPAEPRARSSGVRPRISQHELRDALEQNGWSPERTATSLGIAKSTVHYLMRESSLVRRATDLTDDELRAALEESGRDLTQAAARLEVSVRALAMTARQRGLLGA